MREFNLLGDYPKLEKPRYVGSNLRSIEHRIVASYRGKDFFDGDRNYGYGGFNYDGRWKKIADKICEEYKLNDNSSFLQIGCEKGFLLKDIKDIFPKMQIEGLENSYYAIENSIAEVKHHIQHTENYLKLNYKDNQFDFILALGVIYCQSISDSIKILKEIQRVGKGKSFITLASYEEVNDYWLFKKWSLLGTTILLKEEWKKILQHVKYTGDYSFTNAKLLNLQEK